MNITEAIEVLEKYRQEECLPYMLETLEYIDDHFYEQEPKVQQAFNVFTELGRKFFDPT